jgi:hypothetical protein
MNRTVNESEWGVLNSPEKRGLCILCFAGLIGIVALSVGVWSGHTTSHTRGRQVIVDDGYVGWVSEKDSDEFSSYAYQGDTPMFAYMYRLGLMTGLATSFKKGEVVYVDAVKYGMIQVRRAGEIRKYWTNIEATG